MIARSHQPRWLSVSLSVLSLWVAIATHPVVATMPPVASPSTIVAPSSLDQGRTFYRSGRYVEAVMAWQAAAQHYQTQGDRLNQALSLSYCSLAQQELTQWEDAKRSIEQSLQILKAVKPSADAIVWAQILNTQAGLFLHTGHAESALSTWQQAQKLYDQAGDSTGSIGSQINQAQAMQTLGFYRRSRQQLEALNQKLASQPDSDIKVSGLRTLGAALQTMGDASNSQKVLEQGLAIARKLNATSDLNSILLALGKTTADLGDPDAALNYFEQAEHSTTTNPLEQLQARLDRLKLLIDHEKIELAAPLATQIYQQFADLSDSHASLYGAIHFVSTLNRLDDPSQVLPLKALSQLLSSTVQSSQRIQDTQAEAYALQQWGQIIYSNSPNSRSPYCYPTISHDRPSTSG